LTVDEFDKIVEDTFDIIRKVLIVKAREYASSDDRLYNFKQAADLQRCTPAEALGGMLAKHIVSVYDLIHGALGQRPVDISVWDEKIIDSINYLILLRAMMKETL